MDNAIDAVVTCSCTPCHIASAGGHLVTANLVAYGPARPSDKVQKMHAGIASCFGKAHDPQSCIPKTGQRAPQAGDEYHAPTPWVRGTCTLLRSCVHNPEHVATVSLVERRARLDKITVP